MDSERNDFSLGDILEITSSKRIFASDYEVDGVPFYRSKEVIEKAAGVDSITTELFISEEKFSEIKNKFGAPVCGDILLSSVGTLGVAYRVSEGERFYFKDGNLTWFRNFSQLITSNYLLYWLRSPETQRMLNTVAIGSTQKALTISSLKKLKISLPSISEQNFISEILDSIDKKISISRQINQTLEKMAQAIFKSWFVDFDPVRAKMEGRDTGLPAHIADLFPDELVESELGLVPKGWEWGVVGDLCQQQKGSINPLVSPDDMFEHYSLPAYDNGCRPVKEVGFEIKSNKTPLPKEAVLLSKLNPHIPRVWLPVQQGYNSVCSTEFLAFYPKALNSSKEYIYCLFSSSEFLSQLRQLVTGTSNSHQRVKPDQVSSIPAVIASPKTLKAFRDFSEPVFKMIYSNRNEIEFLSKLRDSILPKLISGEISLSKTSTNIQALAC